MTRRITILGSTGSIGENTLSLIRDAGPEKFDVVCLTACNNADFLAEQALEFRPEFVVLANPKNGEALNERLTGTGIKVGIGRKALIEAGQLPADFIMAAIIGAAGLEPTLEAVKQGTHIGLANKECLVSAGTLFMDAVEKSGAVLLPVDSEHNAIFQVLEKQRPHEVSKLILTASGGPFREFTAKQIKQVTKAQALNHPVWDMGAKITIDSATLMNKGLELIEASYLFERPSAKIDIVIHPQSIVHSLVEYVDGSVLAQMGSPDMRTPIAYALAWPERMTTTVKSLCLPEVGKLEFYHPDAEKFQALSLARSALETGGCAPTVLNAANEIAVEAFLQEKLGFPGITDCIETVLNRFKREASFAKPLETIENVIGIDQKARHVAQEIVAGNTGL
ncbi:MAG: 1-deoxy-D-xylulose-5-phosphate reductoisomerase [Acidimicrobiales bacterium]|nr:1-deoxy-D-xylulose-5-phosphate reductoisomerase [Hyphomonadaceae bacterium]RZV43136.1 MAG: 1-deoxy-D-xylulose-5-phosphate reductoisomerase [Acidimicrobiales bacterium]